MGGRRRAASPLAWSLGALAAAWTPGGTWLVPGLAVLRGPLGVGLAALGLALFAARVTPPGWAAAVGRWAAARSHSFVLGTAFFLYATVGLWYTTRLRVSGDEPHYLLMAQSLWREGDLDLRDNHAREDWREYTPGPIGPHYGAPRRDGRPFPAHSPGLPLLLAPVYAAGGRLACVVAAGAWPPPAWRRSGARSPCGSRTPDAAVGLAWAALPGPPLLFYAFHVYTEARLGPGPATARSRCSPRSRRAGRLAAGLAAGALPWLHVKMIPAAAALGVVALVRLRGARAGRLRRGGGGDGGRLRRLPARTSSAVPRRSRSTAARPARCPASRSARWPACSSTAPSACCPTRRCSCSAWPASSRCAAAGATTWAADPGRGRRAAARAVLADVVGRPVLRRPASSSLSCPCWPSRWRLRVAESPRGLARWRWPLAAIGLALALFAVARPGRAAAR